VLVLPLPEPPLPASGDRNDVAIVEVAISPLPGDAEALEAFRSGLGAQLAVSNAASLAQVAM
jgi:hypothetical protein